MSSQESMVHEPVQEHRRRGSVWLGIGVSAAVLLGRLGIHFALSDPPAPDTAEAASWDRMHSVLQPLAFDPRALFIGLFVLGLALSLIPGTRRTGVGVLLGTAVAIVVAVVLAILVIQGLSHASIEP